MGFDGWVQMGFGVVSFHLFFFSPHYPLCSISLVVFDVGFAFGFV